jgi:hypothetical protein
VVIRWQPAPAALSTQRVPLAQRIVAHRPCAFAFPMPNQVAAISVAKPSHKSRMATPFACA